MLTMKFFCRCSSSSKMAATLPHLQGQHSASAGAEALDRWMHASEGVCPVLMQTSTAVQDRSPARRQAATALP